MYKQMTLNKLKQIMKRFIEPSKEDVNKPIDFRSDMSNRVNRLNLILSVLNKEKSDNIN